MNQDFKLKFDDFKDNNPSEEKENEGNTDHYSTPGHVRNLTFVWPDGKMQSFNYSYLVTQSYDAEKNSIVLEFTSHTVEIKGVRLDGLFYELLEQMLKMVRIESNRYDKVANERKYLVNEVITRSK